MKNNSVVISISLSTDQKQLAVRSQHDCSFAPTQRSASNFAAFLSNAACWQVFIPSHVCASGNLWDAQNLLAQYLQSPMIGAVFALQPSIAQQVFLAPPRRRSTRCSVDSFWML